jgi:hypothetical protein|tara:strand:+ start:2058 stop:2756 length:699 start_codon:yes stop_codon:yes gene_type:complete
MNKILSFSLYGDDPKYTVGMKRNIELLDEIYGEEWKIRIYLDDTVPKEMAKEYSHMGAQVYNVTGSPIIGGMFWRFLPFDDEKVDVFCVRDADSRLMKREKEAVDEWLEQDSSLHIMRDHPHHNYVVMGGMFGFNKKVNGPYSFVEDYKNFIYTGYEFNKMDDMRFLNRLYNKFHASVTEHDSYGRGGVDNNGNRYLTTSKNYPTIRKNKNEGFIGEIFNESEEPDFHRELL